MGTRAQWDDWFAAWAKPPSESEREKCENAVRAVRAAIDASEALAGRMVRVDPQGSYSNRTNVRAESDVDVCVCSSYTIFYDPPGALPVGLGPPTYNFDQFRADVRAALVAKFGAASVATGRKAFDVHENTYRIAADVVPTFEYRSYVFGIPLHVGTAFLCDGQRIVNYPKQHYDNGVTKNDATARRFKALARILKRLRYEMAGAGKPAAKAVQSYLIECLVWNVPTPLFGAATLREDLVKALSNMWAKLETDQSCADWKEVNGIKPLFGAGQPWTREQAKAFVLEVWNYAELAE